MQTVCANESGVKEKERARDANRRVGWSAQGLREGAAASGDARANLGGHPAPRPPGDRRHHDRAEKVFVHTFSPAAKKAAPAPKQTSKAKVKRRLVQNAADFDSSDEEMALGEQCRKAPRRVPDSSDED